MRNAFRGSSPLSSGSVAKDATCCSDDGTIHTLEDASNLLLDFHSRHVGLDPAFGPRHGCCAHARAPANEDHPTLASRSRLMASLRVHTVPCSHPLNHETPLHEVPPQYGIHCRKDGKR